MREKKRKEKEKKKKRKKKKKMGPSHPKNAYGGTRSPAQSGQVRWIAIRAVAFTTQG